MRDITPADAPTRPAHLGRQAAIAELHSPDRLDEVVQVTSTRSWVAVVAGVVGLAALLLWGVFGTLPQRVAVDGYLTRTGAVSTVLAGSLGEVSSVDVVTGATVAAGDRVATVATESGDTVDVTADIGGFVQSVDASAGQIVGPGQAIATILDESSTAPLGAVTYVRFDEAVALAAVHDVTVTPAVGGTEGGVAGQVRFVAQLPSTRDAMTAQLGSELLADLFLEQTRGQAYLVLVDVGDDSTADGALAGAIAGTPTQISAIVRKERPIDRLLGT